MQLILKANDIKSEKILSVIFLKIT